MGYRLKSVDPVLSSILLGLLLSIAAFVPALFLTDTSVDAQTNPPLDDNFPTLESSLWFQGALQKTELVGVEIGTGDIHYLELNPQGSVNVSRDATIVEVEDYNAFVSQLNINESLDDLAGPVNGVANISQWVSNRSAELLMCEIDMANGQLLDFGNQGPNAQTQTIHRIEECVDLNARVTRVTITKLEKLLRAEGIIE